MDIPQLDKLNINPMKYRHEDFTHLFYDLTHLEKLEGNQFKSHSVFDNETIFTLKDLEDNNKQLTIRFDNIDSYFMERTCNTLFNVLGPDDLMDEVFSKDDLKIIQNEKDGYNIRSWHKDNFSVHLTVINKSILYIKTETRFE